MVNFSKILIPLDFTQCSVDVLPYAKLMADKFSAELYLMYTLAGPEQFKGLSFEEDWFSTYGRVLKNESERAMENFVQQHMQDIAPAATAIRTGDIVEEIIDYAEKKDIDLIIIASHGCHKARHIYGSIAESVNRDAGCPVMIIHPER